MLNWWFIINEKRVVELILEQDCNFRYHTILDSFRDDKSNFLEQKSSIDNFQTNCSINQ